MKDKLQEFIQEFGFYIFILFSTIVISVFASYLPLHVDYDKFQARLAILEQVVQDKLTNLTPTQVYSQPLWLFFSFLFFIIFLTAIFIFFYLLSRFFTGKKMIETSNVCPCPLWNMKDFFKILIWIFFWIQLLSVVRIFISRFKVLEFQTYLTISLLIDGIIDGVVAIILFFWLHRHYRQNVSALGLSLKNLSVDFKNALFYYLGFLPLLFILIYTSIMFAHKVQAPSPPQPLIYFLLFEKNRLILSLVVGFIVFVGPFVEELFFRGLFYNALKKSIGVFQAMIATSIIFAVLHMNFLGFLPIFGLALLFVVMYEKTGSLKLPIFLHMIHNGFLVIIILFMRTVITA